MVTYDELRKKNREDYEKSLYRSNFGTPPAPQPTSPSPQQNRPTTLTDQPPPWSREFIVKGREEQSISSGQKNKYGDDWSK